MKMKKLLVLGCACFLFAGCNSKNNEAQLAQIAQLQNASTLLQDEIAGLNAQIAELTETVKKLESENAVLQQQVNIFSIVEEDFSDKDKYEVHNLNYTLDFKYDGYDTKVYQDPKLQEVCYTIQTGDIVDVSKFIYSIEIKKNFIKVKVSNGQEGYIEMVRNPYKNGNFEIIETLEVDGVETTILKFEKIFHVSDGVNIKEQPSETANNLHEITHKEGFDYYNSLAITADYKWVKMQILDYTGWVPARTLSVDRGGPTLETPEEEIYFSLIGSNMI